MRDNCRMSATREQQAAIEFLQINDIPFDPRDGRVFVPLEKKPNVIEHNNIILKSIHDEAN